MALDLLLIGLGIALEPFPLTAFILVLSAERGTWKGLAFVLGWLACREEFRKQWESAQCFALEVLADEMRQHESIV